MIFFMNPYELLGKIVVGLSILYVVGVVFSYGLNYEPKKMSECLTEKNDYLAKYISTSDHMRVLGDKICKNELNSSYYFAFFNPWETVYGDIRTITGVTCKIGNNSHPDKYSEIDL